VEGGGSGVMGHKRGYRDGGLKARRALLWRGGGEVPGSKKKERLGFIKKDAQHER
jgi:hypothetical protein